ncbi:hypothetical protein EV2_038833 [Malus domestica]
MTRFASEKNMILSFIHHSKHPIDVVNPHMPPFEVSPNSQRVIAAFPNKKSHLPGNIQAPNRIPNLVMFGFVAGSPSSLLPEPSTLHEFHSNSIPRFHRVNPIRSVEPAHPVIGSNLTNRDTEYSVRLLRAEASTNQINFPGLGFLVN